MIVFAIVYLLALGAAAGMLVAKPHKASGTAFSLALWSLLVSGVVLAVSRL